MSSGRRYAGNDLFCAGQDWYLNACVGENGGPYTYHDYCRGYFQAGHVLVQAAIDQAPTAHLSVDLLVYPIAYTYRHAVELGLKHLIDVLPPIWDETVKPPATHDLIELWQTLRPYLRRNPSFDDGKVVADMDTILGDFTQIDPNAEAFRFPSNRKGAPYLEDVEIVNLRVLGEAMETVRDVFGTWFIEARAQHEMKAEHEALQRDLAPE